MQVDVHTATSAKFVVSGLSSLQRQHSAQRQHEGGQYTFLSCCRHRAELTALPQLCTLCTSANQAANLQPDDVTAAIQIPAAAVPGDDAG